MHAQHTVTCDQIMATSDKSPEIPAQKGTLPTSHFEVTLKKASKQRSRDPFYIFCGATCLRIRGEEVRLRRYHPTLTEVSLTRWARFLYGDRDATNQEEGSLCAFRV